jgi:aconitase B
MEASAESRRNGKESDARVVEMHVSGAKALKVAKQCLASPTQFEDAKKNHSIPPLNAGGRVISVNGIFSEPEVSTQPLSFTPDAITYSDITLHPLAGISLTSHG